MTRQPFGRRCSPISLVVLTAVCALFIGVPGAQAGSGPISLAATSSNGVTAAVRPVQPAVSGLFQVKAPRVWNSGVPGFFDSWDAFQSRTSSAILKGNAYAFTTRDGLTHEVLYAGVERASWKGPILFEFSQREGQRSVGDLRIEVEIDSAGSIGTVQFQTYSADGG